MSAYSLTSAKTLLKKEFIEHKVAFLYVPGILMGLLFLSFFIALWSNGVDWVMMGDDTPTAPGFDLFSALYVVSIAVWLGYLTLMLFFYFASSFHADRKNNAMLFWKSLPVTDLEIMGTKTLAGLTVFPAIIMFWAFIGAIFGYIVINAIGALSPIVAYMNTGTSLWTFINVQISAMVFIFISLLWYLPLFAFVGLLGALLRNWAVPAFILIVGMISAFESILSFSRSGAFAQMIEDRIIAPFQIIRNIIVQQSSTLPDNVFDAVAINKFIPQFFAQIYWTQMAIGWILAGVFIYIASEYRRRRLDS